MNHFSKHLHLALRIKLRNLTGEIAALYSAVENSITCIGMFWKVALIVYLRNSGLFLRGCEAIQNESLTNVYKGVLKTLEKIQDELCNEVSV